MEINSKKLERTSKIVYNAIAVFVCLFLILLSNKIISDLDNFATAPNPDLYNESISFKKKEFAYNALNDSITDFNEKVNTLNNTKQIAQQNYLNEKESFDNWIKTRKTLQQADKDQEVLQRTNKLDEYYKVDKSWRDQINIINLRIGELQKRLNLKQIDLDKERELNNNNYNIELNKYEIKVFFIRLLFISPILLLGIYFFIKKRKHPYWPLFIGFSLFSLYAFFIGLVPYLPSYGGYIRYTVGIILTIVLGYYFIKQFRNYLAQKQLELTASNEERAKKVTLEIAEKAFDNHYCPSCGKDFLMKQWSVRKPINTAMPSNFSLSSNYCMHCGLVLFKDCTKCNTPRFMHLPFCTSCGDKVQL